MRLLAYVLAIVLTTLPPLAAAGPSEPDYCFYPIHFSCYEVHCDPRGRCEFRECDIWTWGPRPLPHCYRIDASELAL